MELWAIWTNLIESGLGFLVENLGFSEAVSIIVITLTARALMMPLSLGAAYRAQVNRENIARIRPDIEKIQKNHGDNPREMAARTMALYREAGVRFLEKRMVFNILSQMIFGLGIFRVLNRDLFRSSFLWIADLGKPDFILSLVVGLLMAFSIALMPESSAQVPMWLMLGVPVLLSIVTIAALPSAVGIYWATSNAVTVVQSFALRELMARHQHGQSDKKSI